MSKAKHPVNTLLKNICFLTVKSTGSLGASTFYCKLTDC